MLINGDNANTAGTVMGYALTIIGSRVAALPAGEPVAIAREPAVTLEPRIWYNPELRSTLFLVPGLLAYIAMITAVVSTALSVVREKERGTMEQVRMAPHRHAAVRRRQEPAVLRASRWSRRSACSFASMALFDLPMRGSWLLLLLSLTLFLIGALGLGLLISSIADSQQVAFQVALLASFLPTVMLSGFIFPIASMPPALQVVTYIVPARYFLIALRGVVLKGAGLHVDRPVSSARCAIYAIGRAGAGVGPPAAGVGLTCAACCHIMWKELIELAAGSASCSAIVFIAPIVQLVVLGYAATTDVKNVPIVIADGDRTQHEPRADRAVRGIAVLHRRRTVTTIERDRSTGWSRAAPGSRVWHSGGLSPARSAPAARPSCR